MREAMIVTTVQISMLVIVLWTRMKKTMDVWRTDWMIANKLFHCSVNKEEVLKHGLDTSFKHEDTELINHLITQRALESKNGLPFDRNNCIFLSYDMRDHGEVIVLVNLELLDLDCLYVGDENLADEIFRSNYNGGDCSKAIDSYVDSVVPYKMYNGNYKKAELMYLMDITADLLCEEEYGIRKEISMGRLIDNIRAEVREKAENMDEGDLIEWRNTMFSEIKALETKCGEIDSILAEREKEFLKRVAEGLKK